MRPTRDSVLLRRVRSILPTERVREHTGQGSYLFLVDCRKNTVRHGIRSSDTALLRSGVSCRYATTRTGDER